MNKLVLLFSHKLTKEQIKDAKENLKISSLFIYQKNYKISGVILMEKIAS